MINTFFMHLPGVYITPIHEASISYLERTCNADLSPDSRMDIFDMAQELSRGTITEEDYINGIASIANCGHQSEDIESGILAEVTGISGVEQIVRELQSTYSLWFVSAMPETWLADVSLPGETKELLRPEEVIFECELDHSKGWLGVFQSLLQRVGKQKSECLWIDRNTNVTTIAVKNGFNAILFVNAFRLREEIVLRKLLEG